MDESEEASAMDPELHPDTKLGPSGHRGPNALILAMLADASYTS